MTCFSRFESLTKAAFIWSKLQWKHFKIINLKNIYILKIVYILM